MAPMETELKATPHCMYPPPRKNRIQCTPYTENLQTRLELELGGTTRTDSWLDSMKVSSPTQVKLATVPPPPPAAPPSAAPPPDEAFSDWIKRHPSALSEFKEIAAASNGKKIVMFLDYDGTLSPIVDDPDRAFMSKPMRKAVRDVARYFPTAIVTGRCRDKVYKFVRLAELYYAGSHGMDIKGPKSTKSKAKTLLFQPASEFLPIMHEVYKALVERTELTPGARVENNKFCLSVHFRCVDEKKWSALAEQVRSVLEKYPKLQLTLGRKVLEIRPTIKWDKGKALEFLLESLGFANSNNVFPVYIGDDRTDEDAFRVLRQRGLGVGILVSKSPRETSASYSLQDPAEVMDFLQRLVEWKSTCI